MQHTAASPAGAHRLQKEMSAPAHVDEISERNVDTGESTWDRPEKQHVQVCMQVGMCAF
jgi:hypothetical protein